MAMIQKIRDNSALTFIVVGGALLAFVLTDYLGSSTGVDDNITTVATLEGKDISVDEFYNQKKLLNVLFSPTQDLSAQNDQVQNSYATESWNRLIREKYSLEDAETIGLKVSEEESEDMIKGDNPYGFFVKFLFGGRNAYSQNRQAISSNIEEFYKYAAVEYTNPQTQQPGYYRLDRQPNIAYAIRDYGYRLRVQDKYTKLIQSCFFTTSSLAKDDYQLSQDKKDFQVAYVKYNTVNDSTVNPTNEEIEAAYNELKEKFVNKEEDTRKLIYASFPIQASDEDKSEVLKEVAAIKLELLDTSFNKTKAAKFNTFKYESDLANYNKYYKKGEYPIKVNGVDTVIFDHKKGEAFGPFMNPTRTQFGVAQVIDEKMMADSAEVSAIVIGDKKWSAKYTKELAQGERMKPEDQKLLQAEYKAAVDSILEVVKKNPNAIKNFPKEYWADSLYFAKGGDFGWIQQNGGQFGQNFADSMLLSNEGDVKVAFTNQGFAAVIHVKKHGKKSRKLQIGTVIKNVTPGDKTLDGVMEKATTLSFEMSQGKKVDALRDSFYYFVDSASITGSTFVLNGVQGARNIIHWGLKSDLNVPSTVFTTSQRYIVAVVTESNTSKYKTLNDRSVRDECTAHARKKKQREALKAKFPQLNAENIAKFPELMQNGFVTNSTGKAASAPASTYSGEGRVIGAIAGLKEGQVSEIIEGDEGLYVVYVSKNVTAEITEEITEETNLKVNQDKLVNLGYQVGDALIKEVIEDKIDLVDNRKIIQ